MAYLPTVAPRITQMQVNIAYTGHMGLEEWPIPVNRTCNEYSRCITKLIVDDGIVGVNTGQWWLIMDQMVMSDVYRSGVWTTIKLSHVDIYPRERERGRERGYVHVYSLFIYLCIYLFIYYVYLFIYLFINLFMGLFLLLLLLLLLFLVIIMFIWYSTAPTSLRHHWNDE